MVVTRPHTRRESLLDTDTHQRAFWTAVESGAGLLAAVTVPVDNLTVRGVVFFVVATLATYAKQYARGIITKRWGMVPDDVFDVEEEPPGRPCICHEVGEDS